MHRIIPLRLISTAEAVTEKRDTVLALHNLATSHVRRYARRIRGRGMAERAGADGADGPVPRARRVLIVGAGAIGGLLGVRLSQRGHGVTFFARGAHLAAMRAAGYMRLVLPDGTEEESAPGCAFVGTLNEVRERQEVVVIAVKMHQIRAVAALLPALLAEDGVYLTTQNGLPWWYFQRNANAPQELRECAVQAVDPGGELMGVIDPGRIIAAVVYPAAEVCEPGCVKVLYGKRFPVGEIDGSRSRRVCEVAEVLEDAGFKSPVLRDVRAELWLKLWGTVAVNPLSALTHATLGELCDPDMPGRKVVEGVMREVQMVAEAVGERMRLPMERRVEGARSVGEHKTSMLQDVESGRPMEVQGVMGAVVEIARKAGVRTPFLDAVYGTVAMLKWVVEKRNAKMPLVGKT